VNARRRARGLGTLWEPSEEQDRHALQPRIAPQQVEYVEPIQPREPDIKDEQVWSTRGDGVHHESAVRDDVSFDVEPIGQSLAQCVRNIRIVFCDEDAFQATSSARIRRKRRSLTQTLQLHMAPLLCTRHATWHGCCSGDRA